MYTSGWGSWKLIPTGSTGDSPAGALLGSNLHVVVRGMDGGIWHIIVSANGSVIRNWMAISGSTPSRPVLAASQGSKRLVLAVRGTDNGIYSAEYNVSTDSWGTWTGRPGSTCDGPCAKVTSNQLELVVRGSDGNTLWHWNGSNWTWISGATPSAPTLTS